MLNYGITVADFTFCSGMNDDDRYCYRSRLLFFLNFKTVFPPPTPKSADFTS